MFKISTVEKLTHDYIFDSVTDFKKALSEVRSLENKISDLITECENLEWVETEKKSYRKNDKFCKDYCPIYENCKTNIDW